MIDEAVYQLYDTARSIKWNDDGTYTVYDENEVEITVDTAAVETKATELQNAADAAQATKDAAKVSGKAKLMAATWEALTEDEFNALFPNIE